MLKILFGLSFIFIVSIEILAYEQNSLYSHRIGDQFYVIVDDNNSPTPFTFGRQGRATGFIEPIDRQFTNPSVFIQFNDGNIQLYYISDVYIPRGCLPIEVIETTRSEVCVSEDVLVDTNYPLPGSKVKARVLAINRSSVMVEFITIEARALSQNKPVVFSINDITKI